MMGRRRLVVLWSAVLMLVIGAGIVGAFVAATQGERGRDFIRRVVEAQLNRTMQGTVHLGTLSGSFVTDLAVDSIEIRDPDDSLFAATGPVRLTFDPRDLMDGRVFVRTVEVARPRVHFRRGFDDRWSTERIWPRRIGPRRVRGRASFGSLLVLEQVTVRDGEFAVTMPWAPADSLRGDRLEAVVQTALTDPIAGVRRAGGRRFTRTYRWSEIRADVPRIRLVHPDSAGRHITIARLDAIETNPPFAFRDLRGEVVWTGDSIRFDLAHFALTNSTGRASGRIVVQKGEPAEYRIHVDGDSIALADVAWISPSLPTEGRGRMTLEIKNQEKSSSVFEYAISDMDVRAHKSRVLGTMTWVIGGPVAIMKDVDLEVAPLDFALIERFNQGPLAYPFAGQITGRMRGPGGPLNRFVVDDVRMRWRDGNVPGAVTQGRARGELDILEPANATFRGFDVVLDSFDLRTIQAVNPDFPLLRGTMAGTARLDSSWLDLRFSQANLVHRDGALTPSRFTGAGRLTSGEVEMSYDVALDAQPLAMTTLAASFPDIPLRGDFFGPLKVRGTLHDLFVEADLEGDAGRVATNMLVDMELPRYRLVGETRFTAFDPSVALGDTTVPSGELTARLTTDIAFDSLADITGTAVLALDRSSLAGVRVFVGDARMRFGDGLMRLDTLHFETTAVQLDGSGALGLHAGVTDSVNLTARVDSLGGFRRWLAAEVTDTLVGGFIVDGIARGWLRDFSLDANLDGEGLLAGPTAVRLLTGSAELTGLPSAAAGTVSIAADTLRAGGFAVDRFFARATLDGKGSAVIHADLAASKGTRAGGRGTIGRSGDTVRVVLDSLALRTEGQRWALAGSTEFLGGAAGFAVDSLVMHGEGDATLRLAGAVPMQGPSNLRFRARGVPLEDLAELLQTPGKQEGTVAIDASLEGTRADPVLEVAGTLTGGLVSGIRLDTLVVTASGTADALRVAGTLGPPGRPVMIAEGTLPFRLRFDEAGPGFVNEGVVSASVTSDTVSLRMFDDFTNRTTGDPGNFSLNLDVSGTWREPRVVGDLLVRNGNVTFAPLGDVRWRGLTADIGLIGDSISIRRLTATSSSGGRQGRASVGGWFTVADRDNPAFDLSIRANQFHVYNVRNVADIDLSDSLRINGTLRSATLRGSLTTDRAVISIPEIATKDVISLTEFDRFGVADTTALLDKRLAPRPPSVFVDNLIVRNVPIRMGRDVWLRSAEANINLGGEISITRAQGPGVRGDGQAQLALTGSLQTVRGTYQLNIGPVQRTFEVQQGSIDWFGDPDFVFNPNLDISAQHTVRQYSKQGAQPDVRVRVNIGGTLMEPTAVLSSPDSMRVRSADLISYLVTGGPSFEIGGRNANYTSTATRLLISSLGSYLGGKAGGLCDEARVSSAAGDEATRNLRTGAAAVLEGTRFNCGKQVGDRAFVRLDAGLCQVGQFVGGSSLNAAALANSIGVKLDYLLGQGYTLSAGVEPPTSAVLCNSNMSARGFVPAPQQFGFDLFRAWRF
jgi:translocation and assembly module TamB